MTTKPKVKAVPLEKQMTLEDIAKKAVGENHDVAISFGPRAKWLVDSLQKPIICITNTTNYIRQKMGDMVFMQHGEMQLLKTVPWRVSRIGERIQTQDLIQVRAMLESEFSYVIGNVDCTDALVFMAAQHEDPRNKEVCLNKTSKTSKGCKT
jgi:hypothetical protein